MMLAPVDIEGAVVTMLNDALAAPVATRVPNARPAEFVRVTRTGGQSRNLVQSDARVLVECWAADGVAAFGLARMAYAHLWASADSFIADDVWVGRVDLTEPVNFPDPDTDSPRYQFLATLTTSLVEV
jgi:hypothetical protein